MNRTRKVEIAVGLFILAGLAALPILALQVSNFATAIRDYRGYDLIAEFQNIGRLLPHAPVSIAGVPVGRVEAIGLDPASFDARVTMRIQNMYSKLPKDTTSAIYTQGMLGAEYVALQPGRDTTLLKGGDRIAKTQPAMVLEKVIEQFLHNTAEDAK